jgi:hypothetical protein
MWYRTVCDVPAQHRRLSLFFGEVDGTAQVYVNGRRVAGRADADDKAAANQAAAPDEFRRRTPFEVDVTAAVQPGRNVVAVRVDHTKITELNLGGLIRPVYLIERPE